MRTIVNSGQDVVIAPAGTLVLFGDRVARNLVLGSLKARGYRQLTVTIKSAAALVLTFYQAANAVQTLQVYDTFAVPIYSSTNKNTFVWDLTSLNQVQLEVSSTTGDLVTFVIEASDDIEALRSC